MMHYVFVLQDYTNFMTYFTLPGKVALACREAWLD